MAPEGGAENQRNPPPRNHSSNLEGSGRGGGIHTSPTFSAARESIAVISGSGSDNATTPEGGNAAESSSPEREGSPSDAATDIWSSGEAPKETGGVPHSAEAPVWTNGTPAGCGVPEGWGTPLGEALTVILRSPLTPPDAVPPRFVPGRTPDRGRQRDPAMFDTTESIAQLRDGHVPTRRTWTIHESFLSVLNAQTREPVIVTVLRRQRSTAPRNARVIRHLYKDAITRVNREICSLVLKHAGELATAHSWCDCLHGPLFSRETATKYLVPLLCRNARTRSSFSLAATGRAVVKHHRSAPKRKDD